MGASAAKSILSPEPAAPRPARRTGLQRRQAVEAWLILTPILLYYSIFFLFPVYEIKEVMIWISSR